MPQNSIEVKINKDEKFSPSYCNPTLYREFLQ